MKDLKATVAAGTHQEHRTSGAEVYSLTHGRRIYGTVHVREL